MADSQGWDGYRGQPVSVGSFLMAEALLRTVPADMPMPDIDVHPDGQVGFLWVIDRHRMFSLAIGGSSRSCVISSHPARRSAGVMNLVQMSRSLSCFLFMRRGLASARKCQSLV